MARRKQPVRRTGAALPPLVVPAAEGGWITPADAAIAAALLAVTLGVCIPTAVRLRSEAGRLDRQRADTRERCGQIRAAIHHLEERRAAQADIRRAVNRLISEVEVRPVVPWSTALAELSRTRPRGTWILRLEANGPRFRALLGAQHEELVGRYATQLAASPHVEYAVRPPESAVPQVVGRWKGE
jgi:hypothetical protein